MPVILTSSHGGTQAPPGVEERTEEETPAGCQFTRERDLETAEITESVARKIFDADIYLGADSGGSLLPGFDRDNLFMQPGFAGLLCDCDSWA
jgi:hypothetical protein